MERWRERDGEMERGREEMCSLTICKLKHEKPKLRREHQGAVEEKVVHPPKTPQHPNTPPPLQLPSPPGDTDLTGLRGSPGLDSML